MFLHCFRERELVLDLFEEVTGARFHYNTHTIGGNRHDLPAGWSAKVKAAMDIIGGAARRVRVDDPPEPDLRRPDHRGGALDAELALELGITGPILRACGVDHDLRRDAPFHAYDEVKVRVVTAQGGDCLARARVRLGEMRESVRLVREMVDAVPEGSINGGKPVKLPVQTKIPPGQTYVAIETPRGELGTYLISDGTQFPYRLKIRPPSLHALSALPYIVPGGDGERRGGHPRLAGSDHGRGGPVNVVHGLVYSVLIITVVLTATAMALWFERKFAARLQTRLGPTLVGPVGAAAAGGGSRQAPPEGGHRSPRRRPGHLQPGPVPRRAGGAGCRGGGALLPDAWSPPTSTWACSTCWPSAR